MSRELTVAQNRAIHSSANLTLVMAGPGSGKTTVICERIRHLLLEGTIPSEIVCITFTNGAAREIERRVSDFWGDTEPPVRLKYAGTIHGYMLRLLNQYGKLIGLPDNGVAVMSEDETLELVEYWQKALKVKSTKTAIKEALDRGPLLEGTSGPELVAREYYRAIRKTGVLDFDSVLKFGALLIERMALRREFGEREEKEPEGFPKFLLWDEWQDSGDDDKAIFEQLRGLCSVTLVGDPDQSIYSFRGSNPVHFLSLWNRARAGTTRAKDSTIVLEDNFRCAPKICDAANRLIANNRNRHPKETLAADGGRAGRVEIMEHDSDERELKAVIQSIAKDGNYTETAILLRTNVLVERFAAALEAHSIPVAKNRLEAKPEDWNKARSLINLIVNPDNDHLLYSWLKRTRGQAEADKIKLAAMKARKSMADQAGFRPVVPMAEVPAVLAKAAISTESILLVQKAMADLPENATLLDLSHALGEQELHRKEEGEGVTVTTIHSAKGREWDVVYLPAFEAGILPNKSKSADIEEERRLAFVGITRARYRVMITSCRGRMPQWGRGERERMSPSPFIAEIQGK